MDIIRVENLKKNYGDIQAVKDVSFVVKKGELFAFLGLNGAGKSTTINIISGSLQKDGGNVFIEDEEIAQNPLSIKNKIGIVFQSSVLDKMLTVRDNLLLRAGFYGINKKDAINRIKNISKLFNLDDLLKRKVKTLSGGQRRRVDIARALIHNPRILIMDEPTTGLDPQTRNLLWEIINSLRAGGLTVFLTTHYMEEASLSDYVVIIDEGEVAVNGTPLELKNKHTSDVVKIYTDSIEEYSKFFKKEGYQLTTFNEGINILVNNTVEAKEFISKYNTKINDFEVLKGDMNSVFLNVTGKELVE